MGARKRAPASGRPPRRGGGGGEIPADGGGAGGGELPGDDGSRGKGGPDNVKSNITEPSGRAARVIETYHGIGGSLGGDGGGGTPGGKGHAAEASGRPARGSESKDGTGVTPRSDGGAGSGRIPGGSGAGGRRLHGDNGKEDAETIAKFRAANEEDRPFSGLLVLCIDFTSYKSTEQKTTKGQKVEQGTRTTGANMDEWLESYQDYKQKVEALGGTFGSGFNYSQATHIAVMGEIPPGARAFWEIESKEVTKIDWIDQCHKERKLLPIEAKGHSENLICQTPVSTKSFDRKCLSTSTKELKHSTRNKTRAPKKLDFSGQRSIYHRHLVCEAETEVTEKLYDYALRYKMHEYCELPGCGDALCHEQEIIIIPKSVRISKLSTKLILMRCFHRLASLHNEGHSLGGKYSSRNYHIYCDDSVKLQDIDGEIVKYNDENGDLDYTQFVHMLEQEVFLNQELPFDLTEWLRIISQGVRACHRALLCNHVDLMEPFQAYGHFIAIYQIFWNVKGTPGWADLLDSLGHYSGWMDGYIECSFIDQTLRYNDDNIGQAVDYENDVRGLLRALNNTFKHRAKAHQSLAIYIIMNEFREFLSDLQRALHQGGYLSHLRL